MGERGIWVYAVLGAGPVALDAVSGVAGETPRVLESAGLLAVVGDVPLNVFGEEALRRNFEDLDWLGRVARAHDAVVGTALAAGPVVPIRLATVYRDDERVREMVRRRAPDFQQALDRLGKRTEWGVKVFLEPRPGHGVAEDARGTGRAYLARRRAALAAREKHDQRAAEQAGRVHSRLSALAVDTRTHPPQSRALAAENGRMILNATYLVDDESAPAFHEAVADCDRGNDAIRAQLTGPWPPYSFTSLEEI
ncbi:GvpL/GvpF family gas vesicle protein [Amycolatopsis sp.]|uniref:GvpL/GvpF family gas vesicle protein n=1 Tax=Amycolatopsis sp. TaxID=37632 RepID=UPI002BB8ADC7|nr:GvpL/GvpF family gas vesicle protein [Amycolatopsis sp.]HVV12800.1 GvpL/GvpF family gas vesicle protein [Amycolatopsis sp.]